MTREEAIKIVRNIYQTDAEKEALATLIPELAESEDERIIKTLQEYVKNRNWPLNGATQAEVLAYLERKKEPKPVEWEWPNLSNCIKNCKKCRGECFYRKEPYEEQKSAEWSEDTIRKAIEEVGLTQHQINWFKSNVFPPKPEWSQEDNKNLGEILGVIYGASCGIYRPFDMDTYKRWESWLKSLRPLPHWKPTEEQMEALEDAFRKDGSDKYRKTINSLYQDLKKL